MTAQPQSGGYSSAALLLAAGSSALAGLALGYTLARRELGAGKGSRGRGGRYSPSKLLYGARLQAADSSADSTPGSHCRLTDWSLLLCVYHAHKPALPPFPSPQSLDVPATAPASAAAATPRSLSRQDSALGSGLRMVLLVRTDMPLSRPELAQQAARTVLGLFKKQFKRKDPALRPWEEGGNHIKVRGRVFAECTSASPLTNG